MRGLTVCTLPVAYSSYQCTESFTISTDQTFTDCVILDKDSFDPDAVFFDDIVDDEVLPYVSLAVDGLTDPSEKDSEELELRPDDVEKEAIVASTTMPVATLDPEAARSLRMGIVYLAKDPWIPGHLGSRLSSKQSTAN